LAIRDFQSIDLCGVIKKRSLMEVITVESQVFKDLMAKINVIAKFVVEHQKR
jgi:hypothetical protein